MCLAGILPDETTGCDVCGEVGSFSLMGIEGKAMSQAEWAEQARDAIGDAQHLIHQKNYMMAVHALVSAAAACHEAEAAQQRQQRVIRTGEGTRTGLGI
jgi:hypothetical protein